MSGKNTPPKSTDSKVAGEVREATTKMLIVLGDKGGVGKSFVAQALADYCRAKGENVAILESDTRNPDVSRMFNGLVPYAQTNVRSENGWMDVMDFVTKHEGYTIIMNTPAGIGEYMKNDMASFAQFLEAQPHPVELEMWWTMNVQHDSVNLLNEAYKSYGKFFKRVRVVCNLHFSNGDKSEHGPFFLWHESPLRMEIERKGGQTINFPGLHLRVVSKLFVPGVIMPFSDAADGTLGEDVKLEISERWKLNQWLGAVKEVFDPAFGTASVSA